MPSLLLEHADWLVPSATAPPIPDGGMFIRDGVIVALGRTDTLPREADRVVDGRGMVVLPGLINTHHHCYQSLFRAVPGAQDQGLFDWLVRLYPLWGGITEEAVHVSTLTAMAELILSGCTTTADHLYLYPNNATAEAQVRAAADIGMRFHITRGSMSRGRSQGGLPPDHVCQDEAGILDDCARLIETRHDPSRYAMLRVGLAPCSPFSVTRELMVRTAELARRHAGVMLHTHVAETEDEETWCLAQTGRRPVAYMGDVGWLGPDVWWAHAIHLDGDEIARIADTGTGIAHCPTSNMRLGSGICPVRRLLDAGARVGIGVDGSSSNDGGHMIGEARQALLLQRVLGGPQACTVTEALGLATTGGAAVLGRDDALGRLAPGMAADLIGVDLHTVAMAGGAVHDPKAALLLCRVDRVALSIIDGRVVVEGGRLLTIDLDSLVARHNALAAELVPPGGGGEG